MTDVATLRRILYADPVWAAYAIGDLQPAQAPFCQWFVAGCSAHGECNGLLLIYAGLEPPILLTAGPATGVAQALAQAAAAGALPPQVYLSMRLEHEEAVAGWYDVAGSHDRRPMLRMVLRHQSRSEGEPPTGLVRLHADDAPRLERLFALGGDFAPDAFGAEQLEDGVFYGVEDGLPAPELLAAGGTHIVDWDAGIAAIGNFYTRPDARRRGLAGHLLTAVVRDLRAGNVDTIVLNVDERNTGAQQLYERHGFVVHCPFLEGEVARRS